MRTDNEYDIKENLHLNADDENQIAQSIANLLDKRAQHVNAEHAQRLLEARTMAVHHLTSTQTQFAHGVHHNGHALQWFGSRFGHYFEQHRIFSVLLLVSVMLLTVYAVQQFGFQHNIENSDAFLLASDLPPEAYADKGFNAWLDTN